MIATGANSRTTTVAMVSGSVGSIGVVFVPSAASRTCSAFCVLAIGRASSNSAGRPTIHSGATIWRTYSGATRDSTRMARAVPHQPRNSGLSAGESSAAKTRRNGSIV